jgi:uncharacterized protein YdhG (YjbR/CyaY superfamily)
MPAAKKKFTGFTDVERSAMKERAQELVRESKGKKIKTTGEEDVMAKISEMAESDRVMAQRIHEIVKQTAPQLSPKTWYGMPAYANKDGKVVCFFKGAHKYGERYATFGFNDAAHLDDGSMWPTSYGLLNLTVADEAKIAELVTKAIG